MRFGRIVLWVLVGTLLLMNIFNMARINRNYRMIDLLKDNYSSIIGVILDTQGLILELLDGLIEPEKQNYTLY